MVLVYKTRADKRERIPAVNHVDDTGRLQTVERDVNPRYYRLIEEFDRQTGVPILLNTSFNENEPIVMTPARRARHVPEDAHGRARARELRRSAATPRRRARPARPPPRSRQRASLAPVRPRRAPRAGRRPRAAARSPHGAPSTSPGGTSRPVTPSSTASARPPTALATTGRPYAIASRATTP